MLTLSRRLEDGEKIVKLRQDLIRGIFEYVKKNEGGWMDATIGGMLRIFTGTCVQFMGKELVIFGGPNYKWTTPMQPT